MYNLLTIIIKQTFILFLILYIFLTLMLLLFLLRVLFQARVWCMRFRNIILRYKQHRLDQRNSNQTVHQQQNQNDDDDYSVYILTQHQILHQHASSLKTITNQPSCIIQIILWDQMHMLVEILTQQEAYLKRKTLHYVFFFFNQSQRNIYRTPIKGAS